VIDTIRGWLASPRVPSPWRRLEDRAFLLVVALGGLVASSAIVAGASLPSSPFALKYPDAWFFGIPSAAGRPPGGSALAVVLVDGGMVLLFALWLVWVREVWRRNELPLSSLVGVLALWALPLVVGPPVFSRDIYSYVAQGEMVLRGLNPFQLGPDALGHNAFTRLVDPIWGNTPTPYGPAFLALAALAVLAGGGHVLPGVVAMRLFAVLGVVLTAIFLPRLARAHGWRPDLAFVAGVASPVVLLHLVGGAHNDALMLGLMVAGLALASEGHPVAGVVLAAVAAEVKVPALLAVVYIGWTWLGPGVPLRSRVRPLVTAGLVGLATMELVSLLTGLGWSWVGALAVPGVVKSLLTPAVAVGTLAGGLLSLLGLHGGVSIGIALVRVLALGVAGGLGLWLLWRSEKVGVTRAMAITFLLVVALGPTVQPWYLSWGLVLLALGLESGREGRRDWRVLSALSAITCVIGVMGNQGVVDEVASVLLAGALVAGLALAIAPKLGAPQFWRDQVLGALEVRVGLLPDGSGGTRSMPGSRGGAD
jgi:alpha-1,6-mannosyltransferase